MAMSTVKLYNMQGNEVGEFELNDAIFNIEVNQWVLHDVVVNYLANQRQGTHSAKTRSEVRGGGRKPFRQKGTGRGRQGSIRAPHYVGGGINFAKKPRDYSYKLPKKVKRLAMKSALSDKYQNSLLVVVEDFNLTEYKTKLMVEFLNKVLKGKKAYIVTGEVNQFVYRSARNIPGVNVSHAGQMNVYDILNADTLILTKNAVAKIEEVYA